MAERPLPRIPPARRIAARIALAGFATLVAVVLFELLLRGLGYSMPTWYQPDRQFGWILRPGISAWFTTEGRAHIAVNSSGWRDGEHALDKPPGVYRIAVLGDSYAEAMQVAAEETFWAQLPHKLAGCGFAPGHRFEVLNFGVSGYGTAQEYLVLEKEALRYRPDLVLLAFTNGNDVRNNSRELDDEKMRPFFVLAADNTLTLDDSFTRSPEFVSRSSPTRAALRQATDLSRVVQLANAVRVGPLVRRANATAASAAGVEQGLEAVVLKPPQDPRWQEAWQISELLLQKTAELATASGARFLLTTVPYAIQVHPDPAIRAEVERKLGVPDLLFPDRRIADFARHHGIAAVPLAPALQPLAEARQAYFHGFPDSGLGRGHWNTDGHRAAAEVIAAHLCRSGS